MQLNGNYYQLLNLVVFFALSFPVLAEEPLKGLETEIRDTAVSNINKKKINSDLDVPESLKGSQNIYKELRVGDHRELSDNLERSDSLKRPVRPERLARPERPEIPFRINKPERPIKPNKPEKPNKPDRPGKP